MSVLISEALTLSYLPWYFSAEFSFPLPNPANASPCKFFDYCLAFILTSQSPQSSWTCVKFSVKINKNVLMLLCVYFVITRRMPVFRAGILTAVVSTKNHSKEQREHWQIYSFILFLLSENFLRLEFFLWIDLHFRVIITGVT